MFVIADFSDNRKRPFERYRQHPISMQRIPVPDCAPFFIAYAHKKFADYDMLRHISHRYGPMLFAGGQPPAPLEKTQFAPQRLPLKMLVKTAAAQFQALPLAQRCCTVCVLDPLACAAEEVALLARQVRSVRVVTRRTEQYALAARKICEDCGAALQVQTTGEPVNGCELLLAVDERELAPFTFCRAAVYRKISAAANVISLRHGTASYAGFDPAPYGIDETLLLCALYETCGYRLREIPVFAHVAENFFTNFHQICSF